MLVMKTTARSEETKGRGKDNEKEERDDSDGMHEDASQDDVTIADFRTQTIGEWGSNPLGSNPGSYLHENFELVFPSGITLGEAELTVQFTSAQAITDFLPSASKARSLTESYVDPTAKELKIILFPNYSQQQFQQV